MWNGPDMRFNTLEDIYGDTGNTFQAAVSILNFDANTSPEAVTGFGLAVDDMKIEWREFTLEEDATDCGDDVGGPYAACATVILKTGNFFEGSARVEVTVIDHTLAPNECIANGLGGVDDLLCRTTLP